VKYIAYFIAYTLGVVLWLIALTAGTLTAMLAVWGGRCWPEAPGSNCWVFALQRYVPKGGYLVIREAQDRVFGCPIPHVMWARDLPTGMEVEAYVPALDDTRKSKTLPWFAVWYRGRVVKEDEKP